MIQIIVITDKAGTGNIVGQRATVREAARWIIGHQKNMGNEPTNIGLWDTNANEWVDAAERRLEV